jgi:hypothetical protein
MPGMRHTRLGLAISLISILASAACSDDTVSPNIDARVPDARPGPDASTATPDARASTPDSATSGIDAPVATEDAPVTDLDAPPAGDIDAPPADIDAPPATPDAATVPDISGSFLLAIAVHFDGSAVTTDTIQLIATVVLDSSVSPPKVNLHVQFLDHTTRALLPDDQADYNNLTVNTATNQFMLSAATQTIPALANFVMQDVPVTSLVIMSTIQDSSHFCGTVGGSALGMTITGSTFGAVSVPPGTTGNDLPAPVTICPATLTKH